VTGAEDLGVGAVRLRLPASAGQLGTVRLFGAASARQFGADDEVTEDLRLAVSEACSMVLHSAADAAALVVTLTPLPAGIGAAVVSAGGQEPVGGGGLGPVASQDGVRSPDDAVDGWSAELLGAIVTGLSIERLPDGRSTVTFTVPRTSDSA
jgi:hypothetical protein